MIEVINGYEFEVTPNHLLAREIVKGKNEDYKLTYITECYKTTFYKEFTANGVQEKKQIGVLYYNQTTNKFLLWKFINPEKHIFKKSYEVGVNAAIFRKLRVCDCLYFVIKKKKYYISVEKATKVGSYRNFGVTGYNSELQFFIPMSELKEVKKDKKVA